MALVDLPGVLCYRSRHLSSELAPPPSSCVTFSKSLEFFWKEDQFSIKFLKIYEKSVHVYAGKMMETSEYFLHENKGKVLSAPLFLPRGCLEQAGLWHPVCGLKEAQLLTPQNKENAVCSDTGGRDTSPFEP